MPRFAGCMKEVCKRVARPSVKQGLFFLILFTRARMHEKRDGKRKMDCFS